MKVLYGPKSVGLNSKANRKLLEDLLEDMLYQVWENYPEYNKNDAYECVLDHVILVVTEMDDEDDPMYSNLIPFANHDNKAFCNIVKHYVTEHYNDYDWWCE